MVSLRFNNMVYASVLHKEWLNRFRIPDDLKRYALSPKMFNKHGVLDSARHTPKSVRTTIDHLYRINDCRIPVFRFFPEYQNAFILPNKPTVERHIQDQNLL